MFSSLLFLIKETRRSLWAWNLCTYITLKYEIEENWESAARLRNSKQWHFQDLLFNERWQLKPSRDSMSRHCATVQLCPIMLVNVAGFNARLNWMNLCEWLNLFTNAGHLFIHNSGQRNAQEVHWENETSLNEKILECTGTEKENVNKQLCIVTVGGLSIGKFYNNKNLSSCWQTSTCGSWSGGGCNCWAHQKKTSTAIRSRSMALLLL
jgi:hypothetical protein